MTAANSDDAFTSKVSSGTILEKITVLVNLFHNQKRNLMVVKKEVQEVLHLE